MDLCLPRMLTPAPRAIALRGRPGGAVAFDEPTTRKGTRGPVNSKEGVRNRTLV